MRYLNLNFRIQHLSLGLAHGKLLIHVQQHPSKFAETMLHAGQPNYMYAMVLDISKWKKIYLHHKMRKPHWNYIIVQ